MAQPTEAGRARFDMLVDELKNELDIVGASMFGMPSMKRRGGKAFAGLYGDDMVFKLGGMRTQPPWFSRARICSSRWPVVP